VCAVAVVGSLEEESEAMNVFKKIMQIKGLTYMKEMLTKKPREGPEERISVANMHSIQMTHSMLKYYCVIYCCIYYLNCKTVYYCKSYHINKSF